MDGEQGVSPRRFAVNTGQGAIGGRQPADDDPTTVVVQLLLTVDARELTCVAGRREEEGVIRMEPIRSEPSSSLSMSTIIATGLHDAVKLEQLDKPSMMCGEEPTTVDSSRFALPPPSEGFAVRGLGGTTPVLLDFNFGPSNGELGTLV